MAAIGAFHTSIPFAQKKRHWIRRRLIVDGPFQYRMLLPVIVFTVIQIALLLTMMFYPLYQSASQEPNQLVQAALFNQVLDVHVCVWSVLAFASLLAGAYTLIRSNRVAGPVYKLHQGLVQLASGEYPKIKFRDNDELRDFEPVTDLLSQRLAYLASGNALQLNQFGKRLQFLKNRLENQPVSRADVERELNSILVDFSQVHMLRPDA
jgi:hypothetical protein